MGSKARTGQASLHRNTSSMLIVTHFKLSSGSNACITWQCSPRTHSSTVLKQHGVHIPLFAVLRRATTRETKGADWQSCPSTRTLRACTSGSRRRASCNGHRFEENSPCSSPVDHGPMDCDEQRHAMAPSLKEESHEKQKSFRQWTKQHKSTIGTIMCLYFIGTFETRLACI
jgi:hypothetical protein